MRQDGKLRDKARQVAVRAGPLSADGSTIVRDGNNCDRTELALSGEFQVLLQDIDIEATL